MDAYPWTLRDPVLAREAVDKLDRALVTWNDVVRRAAVVVVGNPAGYAADGPAPPEGGVREAMVAVRDAVAEFAAVLQARASVVRELDAARGRRRGGGRSDAFSDVSAELAGVLGELAEADGQCRRAVEAATAGLPFRGDVPWLGGSGDESEPARAALDRVEDPVRLRELLVERSPVAIADLLDRYPLLADALCVPAPPGQLPTELSRLLGTPGDGTRPVVAVIQRRLAAVDRADLTRWAQLWPREIGGVDGLPPSLRFAANRRLLRRALSDLRERDRVHDETQAAHRDHVRASWRRRTGHSLQTAWSSRELLTQALSTRWGSIPRERSDTRTRIRLTESLLHQANADGRGPGAEPPRPEARHRQILLFDPAGSGRLAELRGRLDERTRRLVVVVPGTGSAMSGFHMPADFAAHLVAADPDGTTAALAWMGREFPRAFANEAPLARFALAAAEPLCEAVDGLGLAPDVDLTVIGHSYGGVVVGAAECAGLAVDKVIHLASAGAGPGVRRVEDYPSTDRSGRPRRVRRWALTAPGDPIGWAHRVDVVGRLQAVERARVGPVRVGRRLLGVSGVDLGVDPSRLAGVTVLEAGRWERDVAGHAAGDPVSGPAGHTGVTHPATTAFRRMVEVVLGS